MQTLYLNATAVREALTMERCIEAMRVAMIALSKGEVAMPPRLWADVAGGAASLGLMPASAEMAYAAKVISLHPGNPAKGIPTVQGIVILFDPETGAPVALMDAAEITALRTAAASGLATDILSRKDAASHGVLGTGVQARSHALAVFAVRPELKETIIWGRNFEKAERLARDLSAETGRAVRAARDLTEAAACDIVSTVTASREPVLKGADLSHGAHVNLVGAHLPDCREADTDAIRKSSVWVDLMESALREAGDLLIPMQEEAIKQSHIKGEIGEAASGAKPGRASADEITLYKSLGVAAQDLYAAHACYLAAKAAGAGQRLD